MNMDINDYQKGRTLLQTTLEGEVHTPGFSSGTLNGNKTYTSISEKECLVGVWALASRRLYFMGYSLNAYTDSSSLQGLMTSVKLSAGLMRWLHSLVQVHYIVIYEIGAQSIQSNVFSHLFSSLKLCPVHERC